MRVTVKLFAILRERAGTPEMEVELPSGATVAAAVAIVGEKFPSVRPLIRKSAFAVNRAYVAAEHVLSDGDELALLPAVSGGSDDGGQNWLAILPELLPVAEAIAFVQDSTSGGIAVFLGTTRAQAGENGAMLIALDYEAYDAMVIEQLRDLSRRAREQWPVVKLAILHRVGRVAVGEPSVLIAVSTPHRGQAFEACRWLIDTLKAQTAIWKKEIWSDGTATWVHPGQKS